MIEQLTGQPTNCPAGKNFGCMTSIKIAGGVTEVRKSCVDEPTCQEKWIDQTSDKGQCVSYDPFAGVTDGIDCHFCCATGAPNGCNKGNKPDFADLWVPR